MTTQNEKLLEQVRSIVDIAEDLYKVEEAHELNMVEMHRAMRKLLTHTEGLEDHFLDKVNDESLQEIEDMELANASN